MERWSDFLPHTVLLLRWKDTWHIMAYIGIWYDLVGGEIKATRYRDSRHICFEFVLVEILTPLTKIIDIHMISMYYIMRGKSYDLFSGLLAIAFSSPRRWKHHYVGSCLMLWLSWRENIQGVTPLLLDLNCTKLWFSSPEFWRITSSQEHLMAWSSQMPLHEFYWSLCTTQRLSPFKSHVTSCSVLAGRNNIQPLNSRILSSNDSGFVDWIAQNGQIHANPFHENARQIPVCLQ